MPVPLSLAGWLSVLAGVLAEGRAGRPALSQTLSTLHCAGGVSPADREAALWEMEEHQLQERHQLVKQQLKDQYFLQRHELLRKHEKVRRDSLGPAPSRGCRSRDLLPGALLEGQESRKLRGADGAGSSHAHLQHLCASAWLSVQKPVLGYLNSPPPLATAVPPQGKKEEKRKKVMLLDSLGVSIPNIHPKLKITVQMPLSCLPSGPPT